MALIGNIFWFIFGGFVMGLSWWFFSLLCFISILGIPWGRACFNIGYYTFFPFGKQSVNRELLNKEEDIGTSSFGLVGNIIWFVFAGFILALGHIISAFFCAITIIGIPFAIAHLKLVYISLFPIGQIIVSKEVAASLEENN